jgi:hypothetical protein
MMFLEWPSLVKIKTDGFMLPASNNKSLKVISLKELEKLLYLMTSDKLMTKLLNPKYLFGINQKSKSLKFKLTQL